MTVLETGESPASTPAPSPESAPAPAPTQTPVATPTPVDDGYVRVPKANLEPYGGSTHTALGLAKYGREIEELGKEYGMTPDQVIAHLRGGEQTAPTDGTGPSSQATGFDPDQLAEKAAMTALERLEQRQQEKADATTAEQRKAYYETRTPAIKAIQTDLLKQLGIKPEDHRASIIGTIAETAARTAILAGLKADPRFSGMDDAALAAIAAKEPPQEAEAKAALEAAVKMYQDLGNEFIASGVQAQAGLPGETLGDGPGGAKAGPTRAEIATWPKAKYNHYIATGKIVG
jgi:hypothetical protein